MKRIAVIYAPGALGLRRLLELEASEGYEVVLAVAPNLELDSMSTALSRAFGEPITGANAAEIAQALAARDVDGVVTFGDAGVVGAAEIADALGMVGVPPAAARDARSKFSQRELLNAAGVGAVATTRVSSAADVSTFPAIVKPEFGTASELVFAVDSQAELRRALELVPPDVALVAENRIPDGRHPTLDWLGGYGSIESVTVGGRTMHFGAMDRLPLVPYFREGGPVAPSALPTEALDNASRVARAAIDALRLDNLLTHIEISYTRDGPTVIEVNCRLGGFVDRLYEHIAGFSPAAMACRVALGDGAFPTLLEPHLCAMAYHVDPPLGASSVAQLPDLERLAGLSGVWHVDTFAHAGMEVDSRRGGNARVMDVWIDGTDHDELRSNWEGVKALLDAELRFEGRD